MSARLKLKRINDRINGVMKMAQKAQYERDGIWLGDVYEVIPCTQEAMDSIVKAGEREQN